MASPSDLFSAARAASEKAYAPYSKFPVGAAILADDGTVYAGANVENLAYPEGICAEGVAIGHMIMGGAKAIKAVAVYAPRLALCSPCGGCRQKLAEFSDKATEVYLCDDGGVRETVTVAALLPHAFDTEDIG
ncbi:cytidine deaminase [Martelella endophytica]|uniref:Cytidine deaminase n=1 Tax=Martelella endophytica TaxID=1486262 RepID=A0A0D5LPX7_MAREN|nr:cytidine deaminase [Martelella endophytica]AJY45827.1 cytidine deaminase [Martelella endophytica]